MTGRVLIGLFTLLTVELVSGIELPVNSKYVIKKTDSCPDVGYYFKRELSPNAVDPGPCYLCFCQDNGTAVCWERESKRCDVEKFHHHRVGRNASRARRSPIGLSDVFFRDASRDFFNRQLPEQCKPYESSFSDGCPPADWCIGCTVCDCDANGRWDCHILSFCNGNEKKKAVKKPRRYLSRRTVVNNSSKKSNDTNITTTSKPTKKFVKKSTQNLQNKSNTRPNRPNTRPNRPNSRTNGTNFAPNKPNVRPNRPNARTNNTNVRPNKPNTRPNRPNARTNNTNVGPNKPNAGVNKSNRNLTQIKSKPNKRTNQVKTQQTRKPNIHIKRRMVQMKPNKIQQKKNATKVKIINKNVSTHNPVTLQRTNVKKVMNNDNDTVKLGQKIVKQVMTAVQKILRSEMIQSNSTRFQRSVLADRRDCGQLRKIDKSTYNVKSKAVARNKNKFKRQLRSNMGDYSKPHGRFKREVSYDVTSGVISASVIPIIRENTDVIPLAVKNTEMYNLFSNSSTLASSSPGVATVSPNVTPERNNYYRYSIHSDNNATTMNGLPNNATETTTTELIFNLDLPDTNKTLMVNKSEKIAISKNDIIVKTPHFNDHMLKNWYIVKLKKDKGKKAVTRILKPKSTDDFSDRVNTQDYNYVTSTTLSNNKNESSSIVTTKYHHREILTKDHPLNITNNSMNSLPNTLLLFFKGLNKHNATRITSKPKSSIIRYIRKFFNKLFAPKKSGAYNKKPGMSVNEKHILDILCNNTEHCKITRKNKAILKSKLEQLNSETGNILRSIKIIKGLLHLIKLHKENKTTNEHKPSSLKTDVQKLNFILKGTYKDPEIKKSLTETQLTQIDYVKKNTKQFIGSVRKFAEVLKEIISILNSSNNLKSNIYMKSNYNVKPNYNKNVNSNLGSKKFNDIYHYSRYVNTKTNSSESFQKIKRLLTKYNLIQNTFIRRMYEVLNDFDRKNTTIKPQMSEIKENDSNKNIEIYSKNIIDNLRRLKGLALALNSRRRKRDTMKDDKALEYLLSLMEYTVKQNHLLDAVPVNDGIDLLIDAIKNAPDIKPFRKKVLEYVPAAPPVARTISADLNKINEDSQSDNNQLSKEENNYLKMDTSVSKEQNIEDNEDETTKMVYYKKFDDKTTLFYDYDTTTVNNAKKRSQKDDKSDSRENTERSGFDKFESNIDEIKKYEVFTGYIEEEPFMPITFTTTLKEEQYTGSTAIPTRSFKMRHFNVPKEIESDRSESKDSDSDDKKSDEKRSQLEWIDETYEKEIRRFENDNSTILSMTPTLTKPFITTEKSTYVVEKNVDNLSSDTAKRESTEDKKNTKANKDEVLYMKQMNFLNYLDYGTEKSDFEDVNDSKDDDKSEGYGSYFV